MHNAYNDMSRKGDNELQIITEWAQFRIFTFFCYELAGFRRIGRAEINKRFDFLFLLYRMCPTYFSTLQIWTFVIALMNTCDFLFLLCRMYYPRSWGSHGCWPCLDDCYPCNCSYEHLFMYFVRLKLFAFCYL